jgi:hypothetical protein
MLICHFETQARNLSFVFPDITEFAAQNLRSYSIPYKPATEPNPFALLAGRSLGEAWSLSKG